MPRWSSPGRNLLSATVWLQGPRARWDQATPGHVHKQKSVRSINQWMKRVQSTLKVMPNFRSTAKEVGTSELRWNNNSGNTCNSWQWCQDRQPFGSNGATNGTFEGTVWTAHVDPIVDGWKRRGSTLPKKASEYLHRRVAVWTRRSVALSGTGCVSLRICMAIRAAIMNSTIRQKRRMNATLPVCLPDVSTQTE